MKTLAFCVLSFILTVGAYAHNHPEAPPPPRDGAIQPWAHDRMRARGLFIICRDLVLDRYDADGDHKLSNQELDAIREEVARRMNARRKDMIQKFDKDKDGNLSKEERRHMRQEWRRRRPEMSLRMQQHHANMLQQYDVDKDGILSRGERRKMYADWAKRHPELAKKMGRQGNTRYLQSYTRQAFENNLIQLLNNI